MIAFDTDPGSPGVADMTAYPYREEIRNTPKVIRTMGSDEMATKSSPIPKPRAVWRRW